MHSSHRLEFLVLYVYHICIFNKNPDLIICFNYHKRTQGNETKGKNLKSSMRRYLTKSPFRAGVPEYWILTSSPWLAHTGGWNVKNILDLSKGKEMRMKTISLCSESIKKSQKRMVLPKQKTIWGVPRNTHKFYSSHQSWDMS